MPKTLNGAVSDWPSGITVAFKIPWPLEIAYSCQPKVPCTLSPTL